MVSPYGVHRLWIFKKKLSAGGRGLYPFDAGARRSGAAARGRPTLGLGSGAGDRSYRVASAIGWRIRR
jgi:hypothetical protein